MKIHAIQTGTVRVRPNQAVGVGCGPMRQVNILLDRAWTNPLPIYAWAIETTEGVIVVDTGETARTSDSGYFPRWHPYFRLAVRMDVTFEQEIGPQLLGLGIRAGDVRTVVLTHLHTDHAGGLHHFPGSEVLVNDLELRLAKGFLGRMRGYLPNRWPGWFDPRAIAFEPISFGPFDRSRRLTADGSVVVVPTPGHTPGHVSVIVMDGETSYFLAGDASYTEMRSGRREGRWCQSRPGDLIADDSDHFAVRPGTADRLLADARPRVGGTVGENGTRSVH